MSSGHHVRRRRWRWVLAAVLACALATAAATYLGGRLRASEAGATGATNPTCPTPAEVTVSPLLAPTVIEAVDQVAGDCRAFTVAVRTEKEVLDAVFFGSPPPEVWIPQGRWNLEKVPVTVVSESLASTPVVLVGGPAAQQPATWAEALRSGQVDLPDPLGDSVGALTVVTPQLEAIAGGLDPETAATSAQPSLVTVAQRYGDVTSRGGTVDTSLDALEGTSPREVVATEAAFLAARRTNPDLRAMAPPTGTGLLRFPIGLGIGASPEARDAADALSAWFGSEAGAESVAAAGLRPGDGSTASPGRGAGDLDYLPEPSSKDVDASLLTWRVMTIPSSVLAVFDVSGSMDFDAPDGGRRIDVAVDAATAALAVFPDHARIGLWAFSTDRGAEGRDYEVLEPTRRLDELVGGRTQRERLGARARELPDLTEGGTGLYDTALAAYRSALDNFDPNYSNSVILLTDGANDDPGSISVDALLRRLGKLVDPQRPVRIIGVAVSDDADLRTIRRIAEATGGSGYRADTSEDLLDVFAEEIAGR